jgi:hypothetical protein
VVGEPELLHRDLHGQPLGETVALRRQGGDRAGIPIESVAPICCGANGAGHELGVAFDHRIEGQARIDARQLLDGARVGAVQVVARVHELVHQHGPLHRLPVELAVLQEGADLGQVFGADLHRALQVAVPSQRRPAQPIGVLLELPRGVLPLPELALELLPQGGDQTRLQFFARHHQHRRRQLLGGLAVMGGDCRARLFGQGQQCFGGTQLGGGRGRGLAGGEVARLPVRSTGEQQRRQQERDAQSVDHRGWGSAVWAEWQSRTGRGAWCGDLPLA